MGTAKSSIRDSQAPEVEDRFAARLQSAATEKGFRQSDLARASGVSPGRINDYWKGSRTPSATTVFALADALAVSPRWLILGDEPRLSEGHLRSADEAEWLHLDRFDLRKLAADGKGEAVDRTPIRRDWLYRAFGAANARMWLTETLAPVEGMFDEGEILVCEDVSGPDDIIDQRIYVLLADGHPLIRRYSVQLRAGDRIGSQRVAAPGCAADDATPIAVARVLGRFSIRRV